MVGAELVESGGCRTMMFATFVRRALEWGKITIVDAYGRRHEIRGRDGPEVTIRLHDRALHHRLAINPHLHLGEAYMEGKVTIEQGTLFDFLDICTSNRGTFLAKSWLGRTTNRLDLLLRRLHQYNPAKRAQANVAHHYDLSDTLYELFLDGDRQYSCGYFTHPHDDIDKAQRDKKRHLAARCCSDRVKECSTLARGGAVSRCSSPRPRIVRCSASRFRASSFR
jgi:cyclopropane-fatty-acyl-phospholipid synthase